ncbi:MAG TPA: aldo/keto reductase [Thermoanaerobaculia bacterium]|nr:aldo/keto reductase [Thermoanaerobaculia bacterium]
MKRIEVGGCSVPALGLGTWQLQGKECSDAVESALSLGYRHIDTAQAYGNEAAVGAAIDRSEVAREEVFLTTKIWWENLAPRDVHASVEASLERLGTDWVDLLLIHWPSEQEPLGASLEVMMELEDRGRARLLGVSNFTSTMFEEALEQAPIACIQVEFHPWLGQPDLLRRVQERDLMLTAYTPLARGRVFDEPVVREIAEAHDKTPAQVVLRWLLQHDRVAAIPKAASAAHQRENLEVFDFSLADDEMQRIFDLTRREERIVDPDFAPDWER